MKQKTLKILFLFIIISSNLYASENLDSLLIESIKANDVDKAKELVELGASVDACDKNKATALM